MIMLQARQLVDMTDGSTLQLRRQMPAIEYLTIMPGCIGPGDVATTKDSLDTPTEEELIGEEDELKKKFASDAKGVWRRHAFLLPGPNLDEQGQDNPDTIRGPYSRHLDAIGRRLTLIAAINALRALHLDLRPLWSLCSSS